jgi:multisubunit Na+/H+ antiporter MnhE subunit
LLLLCGHFLRDMVLGGVATLGIILSPRIPAQALARLPYGDLPEGHAALMGALVCMTPGTTTVHIDTERREMVLHVLDGREVDATLQALERDYLRPLLILAGRPG